jgi:peptide/nickel transport system substrate-binding protein
MGRTWTRVWAGVFALAIVAGACGDDDDDDDDGGGTTPTSEAATEETGDVTTDTTVATTEETTADTEPTEEEAEGEPQPGGDVTTLFYAEVRGLDPIRATGSGGSDAQHMFALYGALITMDPDTTELTPLLAESLEPDGEDFTSWTLTLKDGIVFSDGAAYDATAVMDFWTRIKDPANQSPAITSALNIASMEVVDPLTLSITLATPNAHFDRLVERQAFNYVPSPQAVAAGQDLNNEPVGAGPFLLDEWIRDSEIRFLPNPDWVGSEGPYVDSYTIRVVPDEQQRSDTFVTGDGQLNFTNSVLATIEAGEEIGATWNFVTAGPPVYTFNNQAPPFDDVRVRQAFIQAIDHDAIIEVAGLLRPTASFVAEGSPWFVDDIEVPGYDPEAAQELFNEVAAETGGPIQITLSAFQQSNDQLRAEFIQTTLNQFENVEVSVDVRPAGDVTHVLNRDYQVSSWGFPFIEPEPGLFNYAHSEQFTDFSGYSNPEVDAALEAARLTRDRAEREELYREVLTHLAEDVPWWPYSHSEAGFLTVPELHGVDMYHEYVLRADLFWLEQ